jgi:hypothetical protein
VGVFNLTMTQRKTTIALKKIESNFNKGYVLESLLQNYHLNVDLLKLICTKSEVKDFDADKKLKSLNIPIVSFVNMYLIYNYQVIS